jgi:hypothetical protein
VAATIEQSLAGPGVPPRQIVFGQGRQHVRLEPMADLSLTQKSEQSPDIFVNASGFPLPVYLDVNPEILARPRLIRLLRVGAMFYQLLCLII